jgi:threonyl-tRNA synthetase
LTGLTRLRLTISERITTEMRRIIGANLPIIRETVERDDMRAEIEQLNEPYKLEILDSIPAR